MPLSAAFWYVRHCSESDVRLAAGNVVKCVGGATASRPREETARDGVAGAERAVSRVQAAGLDQQRRRAAVQGGAREGTCAEGQKGESELLRRCVLRVGLGLFCAEPMFG